MKPFIRHKKASMALDMAPLIDVVFMLLLFLDLIMSVVPMDGASFLRFATVL